MRRPHANSRTSGSLPGTRTILGRILAHDEDDFEMASPVITALTGEASGRLRGKPAVREYRAAALAKYPDLRVTLRHVLAGADSVAIVYDGVRGLSTEVFELGTSGNVRSAMTHSEQLSPPRQTIPAKSVRLAQP